MKNFRNLTIAIVVASMMFGGCLQITEEASPKPGLRVSANQRYLENADGMPFFWLGGTVWGATEWLDRAGMVDYLDQRKSLGFTVVQICLFWGKRVDDPKNFFVNPPNAYGFRAFAEKDGEIDVGHPQIFEGGTPDAPNDYWDHVEFFIREAAQRDIQVAVLPVWGRRYVNATHGGFSKQLFGIEEMHEYGSFLGRRFAGYNESIIWTLGGDVKADDGGDHRFHYRAMAEGIVAGLTGERVAWNEASPAWDAALITYHPDGAPMVNSSEWFHTDPWLDFNMVETHESRDQVYAAMRQDYYLVNPVKPTVNGEPSYEWGPGMDGKTGPLEMRQQAWQTLFAGALGFTYGGWRDAEGNGPLFSPFNDWRKLLDHEGAHDMQHLKAFCLAHHWPDWNPVEEVIVEDTGEGALQKVAVVTGRGEILIYYPGNSAAEIQISDYIDASSIRIRWYRTSDGSYSESGDAIIASGTLNLMPPATWQDAILIITTNH